MKVLKFGGTSVKNAVNINKVVDIVKHLDEKNVVVVSALGGITNTLISAAVKASKGDKEDYLALYDEIKERHLTCATNLGLTITSDLEDKFLVLENALKGVFLVNDLSDKLLAKISSYGEVLSSFIIHKAFEKNGIDAILKDTSELIKTDTNFLNASVDFKTTNGLITNFISQNKSKTLIVPGFISSDANNTITTLGRGGSDYTAAIFASALTASILEIWTDVSGMFTANPNIVKHAKSIEQISYHEAMELSHFGAKVIYPPTIHPVLNKQIPIVVKNTFSPKDKGTLISHSPNATNVVSGISHIDHISLITLEGNAMVGVPGFSKRVFDTLAQHHINVKLITQASSEHSICIGIDESNSALAKEEIDKTFEFEILKGKINPLLVEDGLSIIALVGDNMKSHQGVSGKMFSALGNNNVNIRAIAQGASEKNISAVIDKSDVKKALNSLHAIFFENHIKQLNLFITGVGNVGGKLLDQIKQQQAFLLENLHLNLRVIGLANSKRMVFNPEGISLATWQEALQGGEPSDFGNYFDKIKSLNLRNSVFVDNTANEEIIDYYKTCLSNNISVVACNKVACSDSYEKYKHLKYLAKKYNASFLFETNVGAGLPIIDTLNNLINSGDKIIKMQAILSGSLNFVFNNYDTTDTFYDIVKQAGDEGYTEPDPRIDLSGVDVMRKILILIRESGYVFEMDAITNESFLPEASLAADTVADFMQTLKENEAYFKNIYQEAHSKNCKLKYVAEYSDDKAKVGLQHIDKDHPFYNIDGKDNIVLFYTERYKEQPLIIKGAGAGADVTASGIFADIIRVANR